MVSDSDLCPYRPWNYYTKPRYYTTYVPTCLVSDRYHNAYRFYRPSHVAPPHPKAAAYLPYIPSSDYCSTLGVDTTPPLSAMLSTFNPESVRYDYAYGTEFASATQDIRASADKLLQEVQAASIRPRHTRAVSLEQSCSSDLDLNATRRITSRGRLISDEPLTRRIIAARYK